MTNFVNNAGGVAGLESQTRAITVKSYSDEINCSLEILLTNTKKRKILEEEKMKAGKRKRLLVLESIVKEKAVSTI